MSGYGLEPSGLHASGVSVGNIEGEARVAARGFLDSVTNAEGVVHHPVVAKALGAYHGSWSTAANSLPTQVHNTGARLSNAAVTGVQYDDAAADPLRASMQQQQGDTPALVRRITAGS